ncbi:MAG: hypothetical protein Q9188_007465 [Gyalolechia gomerana]
MSHAWVDPPRPVRACIFGVDGLLINSEDIYTDIFNELLVPQCNKPLPWTIKAIQQSRGDEPLVEKTGEDSDLINVFEAKAMKRRARFGACQLLPGVEKLLSDLSSALPELPHSDPVELAIASSTTKPLFKTKTLYSSLGRWFRNDACVFIDYPDMRGKGQGAKPALDLFLLALDRINESLEAAWSKRYNERARSLISPGECLVFQDSIADVAAGRAAGMRVCWVPHEGLREVCRGMEQIVLEGKIEEVEHLLLKLEDEAEKADDMEVGDIRTNNVDPKKQKITADNKGMERIVSEDGWAELISSLEHFD